MAPTLPSLLPGCIGALCKAANTVQGGRFCVLFRVVHTVWVMYTLQSDILNVEWVWASGTECLCRDRAATDNQAMSGVFERYHSFLS